MDRVLLTQVGKRYWKLYGSKLLLYSALRPHLAKRYWFWALADVGFSVAPGRSLGIVGPNGSGKTTLLRIVAGSTHPTTGTVIIRGRVTPVLELFAGMQPELTGLENIYLNAAILGMRRREIRRRLDQIVEFSGVRPFLEMPLKHYSTGMMMRLGFSVAIHAESEILLVDEAWSIGDAEFQAKSFARLKELRRKGVTLILVSHDLEVLEELCDEILWLNRGCVEKFGGARAVISSYLRSVSSDRRF